jgi:hypothetical protein
MGDAGIGDGGATGILQKKTRLKALSTAGDPLERLAQIVDFEVFHYCTAIWERRCMNA